MARVSRGALMAAAEGLLGRLRMAPARASRCYNSAAAAVEAEAAAEGRGLGGLRRIPASGAAVGGGGGRWEMLAAKEYEEYRRSIYGEITHKALLVDAVGTLLEPAQPMAQVATLFPFHLYSLLSDRRLSSIRGSLLSFSLDL